MLGFGPKNGRFIGTCFEKGLCCWKFGLWKFWLKGLGGNGGLWNVLKGLGGNGGLWNVLKGLGGKMGLKKLLIGLGGRSGRVALLKCFLELSVLNWGKLKMT